MLTLADEDLLTPDPGNAGIRLPDRTLHLHLTGDCFRWSDSTKLSAMWPSSSSAPRLVLRCMIVAGGWAASAATDAVDFNRDIRPILSDRCYACHGPDEGKRKSGLRLDNKESAFQALVRPPCTGAREAGESSLVARVRSTDPRSHASPKFREALTGRPRWRSCRDGLSRGAVWQDHWAFTTPKRPTHSRSRPKSWPRMKSTTSSCRSWSARDSNRIRGSRPRHAAATGDLDLTGLPRRWSRWTPSFRTAVRARTNRWWTACWDPRYGERMASHWMDLARFADTSGYPLRRRAVHVAVAGLGHPGLQRQHALRPVHVGTTGRGSPAQSHPVPARLPPDSSATT